MSDLVDGEVLGKIWRFLWLIHNDHRKKGLDDLDLCEWDYAIKNRINLKSHPDYRHVINCLECQLELVEVDEIAEFMANAAQDSKSFSPKALFLGDADENWNQINQTQWDCLRKTHKEHQIRGFNSLGQLMYLLASKHCREKLTRLNHHIQNCIFCRFELYDGSRQMWVAHERIDDQAGFEKPLIFRQTHNELRINDMRKERKEAFELV